MKQETNSLEILKAVDSIATVPKRLHPVQRSAASAEEQAFSMGIIQLLRNNSYNWRSDLLHNSAHLRLANEEDTDLQTENEQSINRLHSLEETFRKNERLIIKK